MEREEIKNEKIKPMMCPICDGMYFSEPNKDSYEEELEEYLNGEVQCRHCGWIYDLNQFENSTALTFCR